MSPSSPPVRVETTTLGKAVGVAMIVLAGIVITLVLPSDTVITLAQGSSVVVKPERPPWIVVTVAGKLVVATGEGIVTTLLPPPGMLRTLVPPGNVVIRPLGPPAIVVTIIPQGQGAAVDALAVVVVVVLLGPSTRVTTLPFGRVVTVALPQIVDNFSVLVGVLVFVKGHGTVVICGCSRALVEFVPMGLVEVIGID